MKNAIFILFYTVKLGFIGVLVALFFWKEVLVALCRVVW
jgi:hypothetical protein